MVENSPKRHTVRVDLKIAGDKWVAADSKGINETAFTT